MNHGSLIRAQRLILPATLLALATLLGGTDLAAAGGRAKSKSKSVKPLPAGPEWADTNHDGRLSNDEFKRAMQILKSKEAKTGSAKVTASAGSVLPEVDENGQLSDKALEKAEANLKNQFGKYVEKGKKD